LSSGNKTTLLATGNCKPGASLLKIAIRASHCADDSALAGLREKELEQAVSGLQGAGLKTAVDGGISDFLGASVERCGGGAIHLTQPLLIESVLKDLRLDNPGVPPKGAPAASSKLLSPRLTVRLEFI
jgi:hypothetical protein